MMARFALVALASLAFLAPAPAWAAPASNAPVPAHASLRFPLPDLGDDAEDLRILTIDPRLLGAAPSAIAPRASSTAAWIAREHFAAPYRATLPAPQPPAYPWGGVRLAAGEGPAGAIAVQWTPRPDRLLWGALDSWKQRIRDRSHFAFSTGGIWLREPIEPGARLAWSLDVGREGWTPGRDRLWTRAGNMRAWRARMRAERRIDLGDARGVAALAVDGAEVKTLGCRGGDCPADASFAGRWLSLTGGIASVGTRRDLRPLSRGDDAMRLHYDVTLGFSSDDDSAAKALTRWRWRGALGLSGRIGRFDGLLGVGGGRAGSRGVLGPWLDLRSLSREGGWLLALEIAPAVLFAEETLAEPERLPRGELILLREDPVERASGLPRSPSLVSTRRAPQRAWPRVSVEALRADARGRLLVEATVAKLRDPLDWEPDSLAGEGAFYRARVGGSRVFGRLAVEGTRALRPDLTLRLRYRWIGTRHGDRSPEDLAFLPAHALDASLAGSRGLWRYEIEGRLCSSAAAGAGVRAVGGFVDLTARLGYALGAGTLSLVCENLLADEVGERPGELARERFFGLQWCAGAADRTWPGDSESAPAP
jgi:hypothetical protein